MLLLPEYKASKQLSSMMFCNFGSSHQIMVEGRVGNACGCCPYARQVTEQPAAPRRRDLNTRHTSNNIQLQRSMFCIRTGKVYCPDYFILQARL